MVFSGGCQVYADSIFFYTKNHLSLFNIHNNNFTLFNSTIHYLGGTTGILIPGAVLNKLENRSFVENNTFICEAYELACDTGFSIECQVCNLDQYTVVKKKTMFHFENYCPQNTTNTLPLPPPQKKQNDHFWGDKLFF